MPRLSRIESYSGFYHIMIRGINRKKIFKTEFNKEKLFYIIKEKNSDVDCQIYSYCIMGNHLHLLVKAEMEDLSLFMKKINGSYAMYYNYTNERVGPVFQDRFKSENVEDEKYLYGVIRYIHNNPVEAKIVNMPENYKWSSMGEYLSGKDGLIAQEAREFMYHSFKTKSNLIDFHLKQDETMYLETEEDLNRINREIGNRIVRKFLEENAVEELLELNDKSELIMRLLQTGRFSYGEIAGLAECSKYQVFNYNKSLNLEGE